MAIGRPIGQSGYISSPIVTTEQANQHCRPRGGERIDHRGDPRFPSTALPAAEQYAAIYAGAIPKGNLADRVQRSQADADRQMARTANAAPRSEVIDSPATLAHLGALQASHDALQAAYDQMKARIETIESNQSIGEQP